MRNWKTSLAGVAAALALVMKFTSGEPVKMDDVRASFVKHFQI